MNLILALCLLCGCVAPHACRSVDTRDPPSQDLEPFVARHHHEGNIAELLIPLLERSLAQSEARSSERQHRRPKPGKKVIQVLPYPGSVEHERKGWRKLNSRKKQVVEITPLHGKNGAKPLAYILSAAKPSHVKETENNDDSVSGSDVEHDKSTSEEQQSEEKDSNHVNIKILKSADISGSALSNDPSEYDSIKESQYSGSDKEYSSYVTAESAEKFEDSRFDKSAEDLSSEVRYARRHGVKTHKHHKVIVSDEDKTVTLENLTGEDERLTSEDFTSESLTSEDILESRNEDLTSESQPTSKNDDLTSESDLTLENTDFTAENRDLTAENSDLTFENRDLTAENSYLTAENRDLTSENRDLTTENTDLTSENRDLTAENSDLTAENRDLTAENRDLTAESDVTAEERALTAEAGVTSEDLTLTAEESETEERASSVALTVEDLVTAEDRALTSESDITDENRDLTAEITSGHTHSHTHTHNHHHSHTEEDVIDNEEDPIHSRGGFIADDIVISRGRHNSEKNFGKIFDSSARDIIELIQSSVEASTAKHGDCKEPGDLHSHDRKTYKLSFLFNK